MATTFVIACPDCGKQVKVSDEHVGKRVKCKACGAVYPVKAAAAAGTPAGKKGPPPAPPADIARVNYREGMDDEDEDAGPKQYSLEKTNDTLPRCPFCAVEMP